MKTRSCRLLVSVALAALSLGSSNLAFSADKPSGVTFSWGSEKPGSANAAIMAYLGDPVPPPADLDPRYTPEGLMTAFRTLCRNLGFDVQRLAVDQSEFPFLVYGMIEGRQSYQAIREGLTRIPGYSYSGSSTGSTRDGSTYFSLNMMPQSAYPRSHVEAIRRRTMIRLQMLAAVWTDR